jgi:uncharacterized protein DUF6519
MKGDFTRDTFDKSKHFSRVLMQQGRVQLDADWNEQAAIQQSRVQDLAKDLIGSHGWPGSEDNENFGFGVVDVNTLPPDEKNRLEDAKILPLKSGDFLIGKGHYYVDGILCENEDYSTFLYQPDLPGQSELAKGSSYLVYLDVWERHITALEDMTIREVALGALGPDTATRAQVVWQVKVTNKLADEQTDIPGNTTCQDVDSKYWSDWSAKWQPEHRGQLKAKAIQSSSDVEDACATPPASRYRGAENQLYRVEIHTSGTSRSATFKWSRDNGSVVFPVSEFAGGTITLEDLGRDDSHSLKTGQWVELVDDDIALRGEVCPLGKIKDVRPEDMIVIVEWPEDAKLPSYHKEDYQSKHVLLRRWDQREFSTQVTGAPDFDDATGTLFVEESTDANMDKWLVLENGIQICFTRPKTGEPHWYRSGDYWLIPARTATGDVEWPGDVGKPDPLPPRGVEHHYAPLALISVGGDGTALANGNDCRKKIGRSIDTRDITPEKIGALAVGDYLRWRENFLLLFNEQRANESKEFIDLGPFPPAMILMDFWVSAFDEKIYIGTFSATAAIRQNGVVSGCYSVNVTRDYLSVIHQEIEDRWRPDSLFHCIFIDDATNSREELEIKITDYSPDKKDKLSITFYKNQESPLKWFQIFISATFLG